LAATSATSELLKNQLTMRKIVLQSLILLVFTACKQNKVPRVTVIFFDNQNPTYNVSVDTLLRKKEINLSETPIDIFFTSKNFHLPYYVPTNGILKDAAKDKECDMTMYPSTLKCYEYDNNDRVIKMKVSGSGTVNNFTYKYNDKNQLTEITDISTKFILKYNSDGTLAELRESDELINKRLVFIYE
jgi:hypothetical protein